MILNTDALSALLRMFHSGSYAAGARQFVRSVYQHFQILRHPDVDFASLLRRVRKIGQKLCRVRLYVRMEQLGSHWTGCDAGSYLRIFRKPVEKNAVSIKI